MINLSIPFLRGNEKKYLENCIKTNFVSTVGKYVNEFENLFKKIYGFKYASAVNSGTSALHLALKSIGVKKYIGNNAKLYFCSNCKCSHIL